MPEIVVAGHLCLDIIPAMASATEIKPGRLIEVGAAHLSTGGCVSNVGIALHKLGIDVRLVGKIGDDAFGGIIRDIVDTHAPGRSSGLVVGSDPSSYTVVISPPDQDRIFLHAPACNDTFSSADVDPSAIAGAKVFHFGYPPLMARMFEDEGAELERLLVKAKRAGALVSLDLSLPDPASPAGSAPWPRILRRVLPLVDLFLPSYEELSMMLGREKSAEALAEECVAMGAGVVVVKRGVDGLIARTGSPHRLERRAEYRSLGQPIAEPAVLSRERRGDDGGGRRDHRGLPPRLCKGVHSTGVPEGGMRRRRVQRRSAGCD